MLSFLLALFLAQSPVVLIDTTGSYGTGFVTYQGTKTLVWTAAHVVEHQPAIVIRSFLHPGEAGFKAHVLFTLPCDVALLEAETPEGFFTPAVWDCDYKPTVGDPLVSVGNFFGPVFDNVTMIGYLAKTNAVTTPDKIPNWCWPYTDIFMGGSLVPGVSGGPVFFHDHVIGIAVGRMDSLNFFIPVREIKEALVVAYQEKYLP